MPAGRPKTTTICTVEGCNKPELCMGLCKSHYNKIRKAAWYRRTRTEPAIESLKSEITALSLQLAGAPTLRCAACEAAARSVAIAVAHRDEARREAALARQERRRPTISVVRHFIYRERVKVVVNTVEKVVIKEVHHKVAAPPRSSAPDEESLRQKYAEAIRQITALEAEIRLLKQPELQVRTRYG